MTISLSTSFGEDRTFPARLAALADTAAFVQEYCERHAVERTAALRLTLIVEELFTNTVRHGYRREGDMPIRIALARAESAVALLYEDAAPRHDPLAGADGAPPDLAAPVESRPVGGLGVRLVGELAAGARYAYEQGRNRLWLSVPCAP